MIGQAAYYFNVSERDRQWGFHVMGVGHAIIDPGQSYPPKGHPPDNDFTWERGRRLDEFALLYLVGGTGSFESERQSITSLELGSAVILFPGEWHRYRPDPAVGWEEYWVTFGGSIVEAWRRKGFLTLAPSQVTTNLGLSLAPIFDELIRLQKHRTSPMTFVTSGLCHLLLGRLLNAGAARPAESERKIFEAADYLRLHADESVDLPKLAARLGMSYSGFRRTFTQHFDCPPHRFHQQARIALAKELLANTRFPLKLLAEQLNYPSEFYLMQIFKRHTGLTPTQWRNRLQRPSSA